MTNAQPQDIKFCDNTGCNRGRKFQIRDSMFCSPRCGNIHFDLSMGDDEYWPNEEQEEEEEQEEARNQLVLLTFVIEAANDYHPDILKSKGTLKVPEVHKLFKQLMNDPRYSKYFKNRFCEYCNIGLGDMEYFTVDDQEIMCEDCMELHYEWCPEKDDMVKKITTEEIINWKGWDEEDRDMLKRINEIEEEEKKEEKKPVLDLDNWKNWTREESHQYLVHMWITKEKEELDGCDIKHIYKMSWFESKRHSISHTEMYYEEEDHTRWGHSNPLCRITVVKVSDDSNEYKSAKQNSLIYRRNQYEEMIEEINRKKERREEREREEREREEREKDRCSGCRRHDDFCRCGDFMTFGED